jgi:hypothetical protein
MKTIILSLKKLDDDRSAAAPPTAQPVQPTRDTGSGGSLRTLGFVAGGVGVVGLGVFTVTGLMAKSTFDKLDSECKGGCSDPGHLGDIDHGKSMQTAANVGLVVGLVGLATGVTFVVLGSGKGSEGASVSVSGGGGSVWYTGHF